MHDSVLRWADKMVKELNLAGRSTLEIGSCNVNGSVRQFFGGPYIGIDRDEGPGVDMQVVPGEPLPFADNDFGCVISTEMLEHDERPWRTVCEMARVLEHGGVLLLTARGYDAKRGAFPVHNEPDYWRFSGGALRLLAIEADLDDILVYQDPQIPGFFMKAVKP